MSWRRENLYDVTVTIENFGTKDLVIPIPADKFDTDDDGTVLVTDRADEFVRGQVARMFNCKLDDITDIEINDFDIY